MSSSTQVGFIGPTSWQVKSVGLAIAGPTDLLRSSIASSFDDMLALSGGLAEMLPSTATDASMSVRGVLLPGA